MLIVMGIGMAVGIFNYLIILIITVVNYFLKSSILSGLTIFISTLISLTLKYFSRTILYFIC